MELLAAVAESAATDGATVTIHPGSVRMKLGVYNAILHDRPLPEALEVIADLGLTGIEINSGGFLPPVHIPTFDDILVSDTARDDYLGIFEGTGVAIAGLNCNGNPLHPDPAIGDKHAEDIRRSIRLASRLGQHRVVTMSGLPGGEPGATRVNWVVNAWNSAALDVLDYQWSVAVPFWQEIDALAGDHDVKVALELHPQNLVFNTADVYTLVERAGVQHVGVELDASHLFWQQMDPVAVVRKLGTLVYQAAAKDVRVNPDTAIRFLPGSFDSACVLLLVVVSYHKVDSMLSCLLGSLEGTGPVVDCDDQLEAAFGRSLDSLGRNAIAVDHSVGQEVLH